jgi:hypothetical protein
VSDGTSETWTSTGQNILTYNDSKLLFNNNTTNTIQCNNTLSACVVVNMNARSVNSKLAKIVTDVFTGNTTTNVYLTQTADQARQAAHDIVFNKYQLVIPIGGDGTLSTLINDLVDASMEADATKTLDQAMKELPYFAYLPFGALQYIGVHTYIYIYAFTANISHIISLTLISTLFTL